MVADALNKGAVARQAIMKFSQTGAWNLLHEFVVHAEVVHRAIVSSRHDALSSEC